MKKGLIIFLAVAFVAMFAGAILAQSDVIELDKAGTAGKVSFSHKAHLGYAGISNQCIKCHHKGQNTGCKTCHDATGSKGGNVTTKDAFHKQCKDCHKAAGKGPTTCNGCHKK